MDIFLNTRVLKSRLTGAQRYVIELLPYLNEAKLISPPYFLNGIKAHAWEQFVLPTKVKKGLLFSPSNSGPLLYEKQVVSLLDVVPLDHPEWLNKQFALWYRFLTPKLAKRVRHIITISEYSKNRILNFTNIDESKITVTPLAAHPRFYPRSSDEVKRALSKIQVPSKHYVLCLGSLEPRKNLERLVSAWSNIKDKIPKDIWLVIAGGIGSDRVFQKVKLPSTLSRVFFTGQVSDDLLPELYSGAICFIYPSVYEGFGLPPLEAMASGAPVITGNLTSLPEVVGSAGLLINPYDVDQMGDALFSIIENAELRKTLSVKGQLRAGMFSWSKTAHKTLEVLRLAHG